MFLTKPTSSNLTLPVWSISFQPDPFQEEPGRLSEIFCFIFTLNFFYCKIFHPSPRLTYVTVRLQMRVIMFAFFLCILFITLVESLLLPVQGFWHSIRWLAKRGLLVNVWMAEVLGVATFGEWPFCSQVCWPLIRVQGQTRWHICYHTTFPAVY